MRCLFALVASFALASAASAGSSPLPNPFDDQMLRLSPVNQRGALRRAVTEYNLRCGRIEKGVYRGRYGNLGYWQARCAPGGDYAVFLGPDGTAQVRACGEMKALKLPECAVSP